MKRVLIADDHAIVRRGLREIILEHADMAEPGEVGDYPTLFEAVREDHWDAIVLDIKMPQGSALEAIGRLERLAPGTPVLILSSHPEDQFAVRMIRAGAAGYLTKDEAASELMEALRTVLAGRRYVSRELGGELAASLGSGHARPRHEQLSDREFQVMLGLASGKTVSRIADELHLSVKTISTYRRRLLEKLDMSTNAEVTRYALEHDLA